jgi:oxygen-independent coproporphyrinogen-3 oxidase
MAHNTALPILRQRGTPQTARAALGDAPARGHAQGAVRGGAGPARSLYVHVPFCFHKCHYCDFYSIVDTRDRQEAFTQRLVRELRALAPWAAGAPLRTIFVGGGTPSLLRVDLWERVLAALGEYFDLSLIRRAGAATGAARDTNEAGREREAEFTVECNPETVTPALMGALRGGGVTRVSVGAQSFDPRHLKTLERWHDPANVHRALEMARGADIPRASIDLIYAIPGQTLEDLDADLRTALGTGLGPEGGLGLSHLSAYSLTYEPNTAMTARLKRGEFAPAPEDLEVEMLGLLLERTRGAGLERYEVSNFARRGEESVHNLAYWRQEQWLAAGPSASGHVAGHRWKNAPRLDDYLSVDDEGFAPIVEHESPDARRALIERLMTGVRVREGFDAGEIAAQAGAISPGVRDAVARVIDAEVGAGRLSVVGGRVGPTEAGFLLADGVALQFLEAVDGVE